jgi:hypothetical protein
MKSSPYTYKQATAIAESFQFLKGKAYDKAYPQTTPVLDVIVVPYEEDAQLNFMDNYKPEEACEMGRHSADGNFEVIVIASYNHDKEIYLWMDIQNFIQRNIHLLAGPAAPTLIAMAKEMAA